MKKVKQVNGYAIYQATTQRDADNYNCQVGNYNIYIAQDIRDYGLTNSYPDYEDVDSLAVAIAYCNGSRYAVAVALADELSSSTIQDMDLVLEIERRLDAGDALNTVRRCYDRENDILYSSISDAIDHGFDPYREDFDPYEDHPAVAYDEDDDPHVVEDDCEWEDDDVDPDAVIDALAAGELDDAPEQQPEKRWTVLRNEYRNVYYFCDCCGCTIGKYQTAHFAESTEGDFMVFCDRCIGKQDFLRQEPIEKEAPKQQQRRSHASYYVVEAEGTYYTKVVSRTEGLEDYELYKRAFFRKVAERVAFSDCSEDTVEEIVFDGEPCHYTGWQPGMVIEFASDITGEIVYSGSFPEWDH